MRRLSMLLLAAAPLLPGPSLSGQSTVSIFGGLNLTTFGELLDDPVFQIPYERINGLHAGVGTTFRFGRSDQAHGLGVQLNGTYSQMGSGYRVLGRYTRFRLHYLGANALFDMKLPLRRERLATRFSFGPGVGWMVSCERRREGAEDESDSIAPCLDATFHTFDYGLILGTGLQLGLADALAVTADFQFHWGVRDIYVDPDDLTYGDTRLLNRALVLRGGLQYSIR